MAASSWLRRVREPRRQVDTWHFRPVGQTDPGPPYLGWSEANLRMYESPDWKWDPPGGCTFGNFYMPFEMTVTRKVALSGEDGCP